MPLRTQGNVFDWILGETVFPELVPPCAYETVAYYRLYPGLRRLVTHRRAGVSRIQSHILGLFSQSLFNILSYLCYGFYVVDSERGDFLRPCSMASSNFPRHAFGIRATTTVVFLCLLAFTLTWVEAGYGRASPRQALFNRLTQNLIKDLLGNVVIPNGVSDSRSGLWHPTLSPVFFLLFAFIYSACLSTFPNFCSLISSLAAVQAYRWARRW